LRFTKTSIRPASAEALFGSTARGDTDVYSDRDILIVDDDVKVLAARSAQLEAQGASVASYTFSKMAALAAHGALFVQHLKLEAQVTRDINGRLATLLAKFKPRTSYSSEIIDNAALSTLAGRVPVGARGALFAADILYVGVRNHGVLTLAERGIHVYGFDAVTTALESEGLIAPSGARALSALRTLKVLYRNNGVACGEAVLDATEAALGVLPSRFFPTRVNTLNSHWIINARYPRDGSAYLVLRDLERRLVALQTMGYDPTLDANLTQLAKWIANPRAYASISHRLAPRVHASFEQFVQSHNRSLYAVAG